MIFDKSGIVVIISSYFFKARLKKSASWPLDLMQVLIAVSCDFGVSLFIRNEIFNSFICCNLLCSLIIDCIILLCANGLLSLKALILLKSLVSSLSQAQQRVNSGAQLVTDNPTQACRSQDPHTQKLDAALPVNPFQ